MQDLSDITWARRLKLRHMEMLLALESAGGITAAAERMHLTQPAVSHWLAELEEVVGCALFVRGRRLKLTPAGEILHRQAQRMIGDVRRVDEELRAAKSGLNGRLKIGCVHSAALVLAPRAVAALQKKHPGVTASIEEDILTPLLERLAKNEFDVVVGAVDLRAHRFGFSTEMLVEDTVQVVARPGHPLAGRTMLSWSEAAAFSWVLPPKDSLTRQRLEESLIQHHAALPLPCLETGSVAAIHTHLRETDCLAPISGLVAGFYTSINLLTQIALLPTIPLAQIGVAWSASNTNPLLSEFVALLKVQRLASSAVSLGI